MSASQDGKVLAHSKVAGKEAAAKIQVRRGQKEPYAWNINRLTLLQEMLKDGHDPTDFAGLAKILNRAYPAGKATEQDVAEKVARIAPPKKKSWERYLQIDTSEFDAALARAKALVGEMDITVPSAESDVESGEERPKLHPWTDEETGFLIKLRTEEPGLNREELAERLKDRFESCKNMTAAKVRRRLESLYKSHPELKTVYPWDNEREEMIAKLRTEGMTYKDIASELNRTYPEGPRANWKMVSQRLYAMEDDNKTDVKRRDTSPRYEWTEERRRFAIALVKLGVKDAEIAERLNKEFPANPQAKESTVTSMVKKTGVPRDMRANGRYPWDDGKREFLMALRTRYPELTIRQLADEMNAHFKTRKRCTQSAVKEQLKRLVREHPDKADVLKPPVVQFDWTGKVDFLLEVMRGPEVMTYPEAARRINRRFPGGVEISGDGVRSKLIRLAKQDPSLKPLLISGRSNQGTRYEWTPEREALLRELLGRVPRPSPHLIAETLNEKLPGGKPANFWTINTKAKSLDWAN